MLLSWGVIGHQTVALIAEHHLIPKAKEGIQSLLGNASISEVASWADEVRSQPEYKKTDPWHYINLPLGLNRSEFDQAVTTMTKPNVYEALNDQENILKSSSSTQEQKVEALKFIVHFVGDLHQPMHVSRAEDLGGNKIQVNYEGKGTNLHSLWDSRLIEHTGFTPDQLATHVDKATAQQIKDWQSGPLLDWLWESYQISSQLYKEVAAMKNMTITEDYYKSHIVSLMIA